MAMTEEDRARLDELRELLARRKDKPGWGQSVKAIEAAIAEIKNGG